MPDITGEEEDESWTQTLITVTPEEDAAIRTITGTTVISAICDTPLVIGVDQITDRRTVQINTIRRDLFIDSAELDEIINHSDAECQTFLQGVPKVELPSAFRDEAAQTMYLGKICPHTQHSFQDITRIMNDRIMPVAEKVTEVTQTIVTFDPDASRNYIVDRLTNVFTPQEQREHNLTEQTMDAYMYVTDKVHFILDRVLWLSDPGYSVPEVKLKDEVAQTSIKFDHGLGKVVLDADTQTSLTCEPKRSNTGLLSDWSAMQEFAHEIIDECLEIGVYPRTIVHSILDEIVERCAGRIHLPYRDNTVQTLAPCDALQDKDDEVLRKLRLEIVVDTLESSIIVIPLVGILLEGACLEIRQNALIVVDEILNRIQKNSVTIAVRLAAIRYEVVSHKPIMDDIFDARKKRLKELLQDKTATKLSSSTQTELAGVPDVMKVKEPRVTVCSTCVKHSECCVCEANLSNEQEDPINAIRQDILHEKILRTQDILIAYNPCYLVATLSKIPIIQPPIKPRRLPVANKQPRPRSRVSAISPTSCEPDAEGRRLADLSPPGSRFAKPIGEVQGATGSLNGWSRVVQDTSSISGPWSIRGSSSADSNTIFKQVGAPSTCLPRKPLHRECRKSRCDLSVRSVNALRILKKTFIDRDEESCSDCSYDQDNLDGKRRQGGATTCSNKVESEDRHALRGLGSNEKLASDGGVRIIPVIHLSDKIHEK